MKSSRHIRAFLLLIAWLPLCARASNVWQINLVGDMYSPGRDVPHPTPDKPVYYFPLSPATLSEAPSSLALARHRRPENHGTRSGDRARRPRLSCNAGNRSARESWNHGARRRDAAGHRQGALAPPSLLLVFSWGSLRPEKLGVGDDFTSNSPPPVLNQNQMIGLTAGKNFDSIVDFGTRTEEIWEGVQDDRFFVMVSAYDFVAYNQNHKKVLLWVTKMSLPAAGVTMAEVMPALVKAGGPLFGRETTGPEVVDVPTPAKAGWRSALPRWCHPTRSKRERRWPKSRARFPGVGPFDLHHRNLTRIDAARAKAKTFRMSSYLEQKFGLRGKVALVTGSSQGLGKAMAIALARSGADVIINGRDEKKLAPVVAEITALSLGVKATALAADLGDRAAVSRLIEQAIAWQGHLDILVNNAGIIKRTPAADHSDADWDTVIAVNLNGVFTACRAAGST